MRTIAAIADRVGAWIHADEVYRGSELDGVETQSFTGQAERVIAVGGLSKAYALPGLRLGWLAGPTETVATAWAYHDYTSITAGILSHTIGAMALSPELRPAILERNRSMLRTNLALTTEWLGSIGRHLHFTPPRAGGMAFMRYDYPINSTELADWLRTEHDVFILAGDCFGMDSFVRIGIGAETAHLEAGLDRVRQALLERFG
jgi:aspartate/methionine/tyrosine aminotransferase